MHEGCPENVLGTWRASLDQLKNFSQGPGMTESDAARLGVEIRGRLALWAELARGHLRHV